MQMQFHEIANLFPMMNGKEFEDLKTDISKNGLIEPIWTYQGKIVDGRNRYNACKSIGVEPKIREWAGNGSLISFVIGLNLHRRHLDSSQKAVIAEEALPFYEQEAKARQKEHGGTAPGKPAESLSQKIDQVIIEKEKHTGKATEQAARDFGTNRQYIADVKAIKQKAPEKIEQVKRGEKTITQVKREIKEEAREQRREENKKLVEDKPITQSISKCSAKFATIVIDPPWDWGDENDVDQLGRARPTYQTMSIHQLMDLPIKDIADDDCHIYLWITNRSLPKGFTLLDVWGFRYITCLTWCKPSIGMGNYFRGSTEQVLFGVRGSQPLNRKDVGTWFSAPRGSEHSSKPDEFYKLIESCSPGPRADVFSRKQRDGWIVLGAES
jgi:N6-adenosine-specific RNA methylase IME4/ParB-like chromosome segregation protein Spo0J